MKIDWREIRLSNHQCVVMQHLAESLGDTGNFAPVLPADCGAKVIALRGPQTSETNDWVACSHDRLTDDSAARVDYAKTSVFVVDYMYRSASNYKIHGEALLEGSLTPEEHALLLTVLGGSEDGCFIPSQIGLRDMQHDAGWEVDFEGEDHVWHTFDGLRPADKQSSGPALSMATLLEECRKALRSGWDDTAAMDRLMG